MATDALAEAIESYLRTGSYDPLGTPWPGNVIERSRRAHDALIQALVTEVARRAKTRPAPELAQGFDGVAFTRAKVEPLVCGLFPRAQRQAVLALLERAVVFLTPANVEPVLRHQPWLGTAWDLANIYLGSIGAEPLGEGAPAIVGLSEETTCFVALEYFSESDPFADFVVHEMAHMFHNCKRDTVGLPVTRRREWLLDIDYVKRETFAYHVRPTRASWSAPGIWRAATRWLESTSAKFTSRKGGSTPPRWPTSCARPPLGETAGR